MRDLADVLNDEMREDRKVAHIPSFLAGPLAALRDRAARVLPMHMMTRDVMLTSSAIAEGAVDKVAAPGAPGFADLAIAPRKVSQGIAMEHVRHWRKGGYDAGTNEVERVP